MRSTSIFGALVGASWATAAASADFYLKIDGVAAHGGNTYLKVSAGDLDGDGMADEGVVRLQCAASKVVAAHYTVKSPRDVATGQASGKRQHGPVTFIKEWGPSTPQLREMKVSYDVKKVEGTGARIINDGWQMLSLTDSDGLCPAAEAAARVIKTRSNIQNN